jgi:hypothetical protein
VGGSEAPLRSGHVMVSRTRGDVWVLAGASALVAPLSGMMADRVDRKRIMITRDLLGAAVYIGMAVTRHHCR